MAFLDETGLAELWSLVKAEDLKNAKIAAGQYDGTGAAGASNACVISCGFMPKAVFVRESDKNLSGNETAKMIVFVKGAVQPYGVETSTIGYAYRKELTVNYSNTGISWYIEASADDASGIVAQMNYSGKTYLYIAIG